MSAKDYETEEMFYLNDMDPLTYGSVGSSRFAVVKVKLINGFDSFEKRWVENRLQFNAHEVEVLSCKPVLSGGYAKHFMEAFNEVALRNNYSRYAIESTRIYCSSSSSNLEVFTDDRPYKSFVIHSEHAAEDRANVFGKYFIEKDLHPVCVTQAGRAIMLIEFPFNEKDSPIYTKGPFIIPIPPENIPEPEIGEAVISEMISIKQDVFYNREKSGAVESIIKDIISRFDKAESRHVDFIRFTYSENREHILEIDVIFKDSPGFKNIYVETLPMHPGFIRSSNPVGNRPPLIYNVRVTKDNINGTDRMAVNYKLAGCGGKMSEPLWFKYTPMDVKNYGGVQ